MVPVLDGAGELLAAYDVVFCDVWGVLHNGIKPYAAAGDALARFRAAGGTVVLVSNSPAPSSAVASLLDHIGVRRDAWDAAITSGDLTRTHLVERGYQRIHHIGPPRDLRVFAGLDLERVDLPRAAAIVCTGVVDDRSETGETYRPILLDARERALPLVCGNPDLIVEVGGELLACAGMVAALYEEMGGSVYWAGKPHAPAYEGARQLAESARGEAVPRNRIIAIGDAIRTDLAGAADYDVDCLFIAHGIHRDELMPAGRIDADSLARLLQSTPHRPVAAMPGLA